MSSKDKRGQDNSENHAFSRDWNQVELTRREFMVSAGLLTGGMAFAIPMSNDSWAASAKAQESGPITSVPLAFRVNGQHRSLSLDPRITLLDLLREHLDLTGTKKGCDHGQCGAYTVLVNGRRINSCLSLAVSHDGDDITTIEGSPTATHCTRYSRHLSNATASSVATALRDRSVRPLRF